MKWLWNKIKKKPLPEVVEVDLTGGTGSYPWSVEDHYHCKRVISFTNRSNNTIKITLDNGDWPLDTGDTLRLTFQAEINIPRCLGSEYGEHLERYLRDYMIDYVDYYLSPIKGLERTIVE